MEAKDKALDLVSDFYAVQSDEYDYGINWKMAKQCAIILVDEVIKDRERLKDALFYNSEYWGKVKQEIQKL
jgi:hypothetical protein